MMSDKTDLINTIDLLSEARDLNEAGLMALSALSDKNQQNALVSVLGAVAAKLAEVNAKLDARLEGEGK